MLIVARKINWSACPQHLWRHVPAVPIVGDDADRLLVVTRDHASDYGAPVRVKRDALADAKLEHAGVGIQLSQKP
jgi:hypothetical protein